MKFRVNYITLIVTFCLIEFINGDNNNCILEGQTWSTEGQMDILAEVTYKQCITAFIQNSDARGFTWYGDEEIRFKDVCVIFGSLEEQHECTGCISVKKPEDNDYCFCFQQEGECEISENNFIDGYRAESEFQ